MRKSSNQFSSTEEDKSAGHNNNNSVQFFLRNITSVFIMIRISVLFLLSAVVLEAAPRKSVKGRLTEIFTTSDKSNRISRNL